MEEKNEINNNSDNVTENKKGNNKIGLVIIVGLLLIGVGVGCFFLGQNFASKNSSNDDNTKESESKKNKENTSNDNKEENEQNNDKKDSSIQGYTLELNNCLNCDNISIDATIKEIDEEHSAPGLVKVLVKEDKRTVEINIIAEKINSYGYNVEDKTITKHLDKNVKQVLITSYGGDSGLLTIHYLMEDGTVEYTKVFDEVLKDNFNNLNDETLFNTKEFNDVKNITKLVSVLYEGDLPAYGVVAITNDGHFYSLKV